MEVRGQLHAPAALSPVITGYEAEWTPEPVWMWWKWTEIEPRSLSYPCYSCTGYRSSGKVIPVSRHQQRGVVQTGSGTHPASYPMGDRGFPGCKAAEEWSWLLTINLVQRSRMRGVMQPLPPIRLR